MGGGRVAVRVRAGPRLEGALRIDIADLAQPSHSFGECPDRPRTGGRLQRMSKLPPDIARYIQGPGPESLQFDFLIGDWTVEGTRYAPTGEIAMSYTGVWRAEYRHDKRMVVDDFSIHLPDGTEVSSFVTVRSYSPLTNRWEIAGLGAFQTAMQGEWFGAWSDGEMVLQAKARGPDGRDVRNRIRFHDIAAETFHWESLISFDDGATWMKAASLIATRKR